MQASETPFAGAGLDFLAQAARSTGAPSQFEQRLRFAMMHAEPGHVRIHAEPDGRCTNPMQTVHGGYLATLLDAAMSASVHSLLQAGQQFTTVEIKISFIKPAAPLSFLSAAGKVRKAGRRIAFADGEIHSGNGDLIATGTATCLIWQEPACHG